MDPAIKRALLAGTPTSEVALTFGLHPYTISRFRKQLGIRAWNRQRRLGLDSTEGQDLPYTAQRRSLSEDDLPAYRDVIAAGRESEKLECKRREWLWDAVTKASARPFSTGAMLELYRVRHISAAEHWATIGKAGYRPAGRNGHGAI